jgi:hypothetical protein
MVCKEAKTGAKGAKAFVAQTCFLIHPKAKFQHKQWGLEWEERDEAFMGRAHLNKGGPKVK